MEHIFAGKWITDEEFYSLEPRNVFHKQLEKVELPCDLHRNRHILFRKRFAYENDFKSAKIYISADDYYKLYINGEFVGQGPAPSYHFRYNYNVIDISAYIKRGVNVIAVHTLYQGLINRVWQSGDNRHGTILDLTIDDRIVVASDETFKTAPHTAYRETGTCGYETQFLEEYDSNAPEIGFCSPCFDDTLWKTARLHRFDDHILTKQKSHMLVFENIPPVRTCVQDGHMVLDFGAVYVGYLHLSARGRQGACITVRCGQELDENGAVRFELRANCRYEENWILSDGESTLDQFDYKSFRYAELVLPEGVRITEVTLAARHYPFELKSGLKEKYSENEDLKRIWELCLRTQKYGVQEVIQDCMEREKGFYLGDGCYTALTNMLLTQDDSMVRKLIDDAFSSAFITDTLVTCMDCSFMQEIAEYPLMMIFLIFWHYQFTKDTVYLSANFPKAVKLLEAYREQYERGYLLRDLDKWCVVEWPKNFQHEYDVDITEGKVCHEAHISINAYYIQAVRTVNRIADILRLKPYRDEEPLLSAFYKTFYDPEKALFRDGENTEHISLVGNSFPFAFGLCPDEACKRNIIAMIEEKGVSSLSFFCVFPILWGFVQTGRFDLLQKALLDDGAWKRMLREDATATFEGWGRDTKWNTSLFHLTMSYAAVFMADVDLEGILR